MRRIISLESIWLDKLYLCLNSNEQKINYFRITVNTIKSTVIIACNYQIENIKRSQFSQKKCKMKSNNPF